MNEVKNVFMEDALGLFARLGKHLDITRSILSLFTKNYSHLEFVERFLVCLKEWLECECIGIRVLNRQGYIPFESYIGYGREFCESENWLSVQKDNCICIRVVTGHKIPGDDDFITPGGSFYCSDFFDYVNGLSEEQFKLFRGACFRSGYRSIAIVPIVFHNQTIGVIHVADTREGKVPRESIEIMEIVAPILGQVLRVNHQDAKKQENLNLAIVINNLLMRINNLVINYKKATDVRRTGGAVAGTVPTKTRQSGLVAKYEFQEIISCSDLMIGLLENAKKISRTEQPVLIIGESGSGKELLSNAIHNESIRASGPFVALNCASFNKSLIESELFGYSEGAFTGACKGGKKGKIELANHGTLFLDEVGDLPLNVQAMLLRTIEEKEILKIGDERITRVDFRLICATNKNLKELCEKGRFRHDLYYRLAGYLLFLPSLRQRREDIELIAKHILSEINKREGFAKAFSPEALKIMQKYDWPGNIRELKNLVESGVILSKGQILDAETIENLLEINSFVADRLTDNTSKKAKFFKNLKDMNGKVSAAAKKMNLPRATAYRWLKEKDSS